VAKSGVIYMFMGEFYGRIDEKGRITIPTKLRYDLGNDFIITRGLDGCIFIYPKTEWTTIIQKYKELPNTKDTRTFMRTFLSCATETNLDKQGRVNITQPLVDWASLNKDIVVIGVNERLEIWSKEVWENYIDSNKDNLSDIADNLFQTNAL
jgi:MraZ protein